MSPIVRPARVADLDGVLTLYKVLRPHDPELSAQTATDAFSTLVERDDIDVLVCEDNGVLAATCMLAIIPNLASGARPFGVIEHVVTLPACRRQGHARRILEHALALAWSRGCYKVILLSGAHRSDAHKLYESVLLGALNLGSSQNVPARSNISLQADRER
jgi:GNAT superfamily N-acetyltransferase